MRFCSSFICQGYCSYHLECVLETSDVLYAEHPFVGSSIEHLLVTLLLPDRPTSNISTLRKKDLIEERKSVLHLTYPSWILQLGQSKSIDLGP